jgi:hypothetical protein
LIRVHRQQIFTITPGTSSADLHLQQLKWPIEYLFVGAKVKDYFSSSDAGLMRQNLDAWDRYSYYANATYKTTGQNILLETALCAGAVTTDGTAADAAITLGMVDDTGALDGTATLAQALTAGDTVKIGGAYYGVSTGAAAAAAVTGVVVRPASSAVITPSTTLATSSRKVTVQGLEHQVKTWSATLDTINISAHSIDIYKEFPTAFFNSYTTYHYGGFNLNAPKDVGSLFIPFCLYPGTYQPSGHINISRAREFYLSFTSAFFGSGSVSSSTNGASTTNGLTKCILIYILGQVIQKSMASWVHINVPSNIFKLRETLVHDQILSDYRNVFVAAGKPSWYSKNSDIRDNPQARVVSVPSNANN